ncbi:pantoate--beta-alanine ligase [Saccharicrinis sp. FJH54]|uniref:pantoate--beta-alanine ligase n=1 Tax=Saccharicrinis sp. FJH54 TaxID=3344665 RepID=UPI0035D4D21E
MKLVKTVRELRSVIDGAVRAGKSVGFVPTMGALHKGHLSLVECSLNDCGFTVVSIFVNPTQFNNPEDLKKYPRTLENDLKLLEPLGVDLVFNPEAEEMYPEPDTRNFNFGPLESVMEGAHRPGHFNGVAQIVSKLFDAVQPDKAYFGEKDFQQLTIIKAMVREYNYKVEIVPCAIMREDDGLAMSSRNVRLTAEQRNSAVRISQALFKSRQLARTTDIDSVKKWVVDYINDDPELEVEYFEISDVNNLQPVASWHGHEQLIGCVAVFAGKIRLIDNIIY